MGPSCSPSEATTEYVVVVCMQHVFFLCLLFKFLLCSRCCSDIVIVFSLLFASLLSCCSSRCCSHVAVDIFYWCS